MEQLMEQIQRIEPLCLEAMKEAKKRLDSIAKPLNSLGLLEEALIQIAGITRTSDVRIEKRCVVVFCADHGVVSEHVTQTGSEVTAIVAEDITKGTANINRMAQSYHTDVLAVDIGMKKPSEELKVDFDKIFFKKIAFGTENIAKGPAMTVEQAKQAILVGMDIVRDLKDKGYQILVTGEMGIGNTTSASALASVLLKEPVKKVTGRGAGLDRIGLERKIDVIERAIQKNKPEKREPLSMLAKIGGYEIAGMTGMFLGGAIYQIPIVIDGMISAISAAIAHLLHPMAKEYMLASHVSKEPAGKRLLEFIEKKPLIHAELCLGEGTGGILLLALLDGMFSVYHFSHRFEELPMKKYEEFET